jgi:hypothetical protein
MTMLMSMNATPIASLNGPKLVTVDESTAKQWLANNHINRYLRRGRISAYARDMANGRWRVDWCNPIVFDVDGNLIQGQHRLHAFLLSGLPSIQLWVQCDIEPSAQLVMDCGLTRSMTDYERFHHPELKITNKTVAIAKAMENGLKGPWAKNSTRNEDHEYLERHLDAVKFVVNLFPTHIKGVSVSPLMAVFGRAFYSQDVELLNEAAEILKTGRHSEAHHASLFKLRDWLKEASISGSTAAREIYSRTERALYAFLNKQSLGKNYGTQKELFPIDGEAVMDVRVPA